MATSSGSGWVLLWPIAGFLWATQVPARTISQPSAAASANDSGEVVEELQEIIVTATRRSEAVQSIPGQVTAVTANDLSQINAHSLGDFAAYVPGLNTGATSPAFSLIAIRGVTTGSQLSSAIGLYLDDVPLGASSSFGLGAQSFNVNVFDLDRVEVLNGPQGTLYGAGSLGGALRYITAAPDPQDLSAKVEAEGSSTEHTSHGNYAIRGMVNLPIGNDIGALRLDGVHEYDAGFVHDPIYHGGDAGFIRTEAGRMSLLLQPIDSLDVRLSGFIQRVPSEGLDAAFRDFKTHAPTIGTYDQAYQLQQPSVSSVKLFSGVVNWSLPFAKLTSITGYQSDHGYGRTDQSLVYDAVLSSFGAGTDPWELYVDTETKKLTQELRLVSSSSEHFQWLAGGYFDHEITDEVVQLYDEAHSGGTFLGLPPFGDFVPSSYREVAGYADGTIFFTKALSLDLGIRYSDQHQGYQQTTSGLLATGTARVIASPLITTNQSVTTYSINPKFQVTDKIMLYARAASGFRPGGANFSLLPGLVNPTFKPDKLWNYELGEKSTFLENRALLNFDIYDIEWKNIQITVNNGGVNQLENAGDARVKGAELSFNYRVLSALTFGGSAAYTDARLTTTAPVIKVNRTGTRLPLSPRFNFALLGSYDLRLSPAISSALTVTDRYVGERNSGFGTSVQPLYELGAFNTVDLDWALSFPHGFGVSLYLKNVFNEAGELAATTVANVYNPAAPAAIEISQPRTVGAVLKWDFN